MIKKLTIALSIVALAMGLLLALVMQPLLPQNASKYTLPHINPEELARHVHTFAVDMHPRCYDHPENLEAVVEYIERHMIDAGGHVYRQTFSVKGQTYTNVVALFGPLSDTIANAIKAEDGASQVSSVKEIPLVVVGAHYDSYGENDLEIPLYTPGADDNASGVAGLLALASAFKNHPPAGSVMLVAYCLEEPPFFATKDMGSAVHAKSLSRINARVTAMLSLEMIGYFSDNRHSQHYPLDEMNFVYPDKGNFISVIGRVQDIPLTRTVKEAMRNASDLPVLSMNAPAFFPGLNHSDHLNFWDQGYPAVMVTDTAFHRNFAYHTALDTPDRLDYERMAKVVQGIFAAVTTLADIKKK